LEQLIVTKCELSGGAASQWAPVKTNPSDTRTLTARPAVRRVIFGAFAMMGMALLALTPARAAERWETLQAIHCIENPDNRQTPGPCGELGAYQFRSETWRMYSRRPFSEALDRKCSDEIAVRHYEWIKSGLARGGVAPTVYNIALAWNAGVSAVVSDRIPASSRDYAARVSNVAAELRSRVASAR